MILHRGRLASFEVPIEMRCGHLPVGWRGVTLVIWLMATRNPANQLRLVVEIPLFTGFYTSQVVHDFLNQQYFWRELEGGSIPREVCMFFFLVGGKIIQRGMWNFYGLMWSWKRDFFQMKENETTDLSILSLSWRVSVWLASCLLEPVHCFAACWFFRICS